MAYIGMAYLAMAYAVMACIGMAYTVMACIVMAYTVMAQVVMACSRLALRDLSRFESFRSRSSRTDGEPGPATPRHQP